MQWDFGDMCGALRSCFSLLHVSREPFPALPAHRMFKAMTDHVAITTKLHRAGFNSMHMDSDEMFLRKLDDLAAAKIIPDYRAKA